MRRALAVTTAAAALALSACGGDGDNSSASSGQSSRERAQEGALKFARCMRQNGVDMPDPEIGEDGIRIRRRADDPAAGGKAMGESAKERAAQQKCQKHLKEGLRELTPEKRAELRDAGVKYAQCMRDNGISNMPDPQPDGGMMLKSSPGDPNSVNPESPTFQAAHEQCERHLAKVRPFGEEESP